MVWSQVEGAYRLVQDTKDKVQGTCMHGIIPHIHLHFACLDNLESRLSTTCPIIIFPAAHGLLAAVFVYCKRFNKCLQCLQAFLTIHCVCVFVLQRWRSWCVSFVCSWTCWTGSILAPGFERGRCTSPTSSTESSPRKVSLQLHNT